MLFHIALYYNYMFSICCYMLCNIILSYYKWCLFLSSNMDISVYFYFVNMEFTFQFVFMAFCV